MKSGNEIVRVVYACDIDIEIRCPYCGNKTKVKFRGGNDVVECDSYDGGCNKQFLLSSKSKILWNTKKIEVED